MTPVYRIKDVAARLMVDPGRVLGWIKAGKLLAIDVSEGSGERHRWRITPEDLAAFEASRKNQPPAKVRRRCAKSGWNYQYF
jgi:hypothetical protein